MKKRNSKIKKNFDKIQSKSDQKSEKYLTVDLEETVREQKKGKTAVLILPKSGWNS